MEQPNGPAKGQTWAQPPGARWGRIALLLLAAWVWGWAWVAPVAPHLAATMQAVGQAGIVPHPQAQAVEAIPVWGAALLPALAWLPWLMLIAGLTGWLPRWGRGLAALLALLLCGLAGQGWGGWWGGAIAAGAILIPAPFHGFGNRRGALAGLAVGLALLSALPQGSTALWGRDVLLGLPGGAALVDGYYRVSPLASRPFEPLIDHGQPVGAWIAPEPIPRALTPLLRGIGVAVIVDASGTMGDFTIAPAPAEGKGWLIGNRAGSGEQIRLEVSVLGRDAWLHAIQTLSAQSDTKNSVRQLLGWGLLLGGGVLGLMGLVWLGGRSVAHWGMRPVGVTGSGGLALLLIASGAAPPPAGDVWENLNADSGGGWQRIALARKLAEEVADGRALTMQQWQTWLGDTSAPVRLYGAKGAAESGRRDLLALLLPMLAPDREPALIVSCKVADAMVRIPGDVGAGVLDTLVRSEIFPWYLQGYAYRALRQRGWTP